ncbi:MAG TPA: TonB-dependent receptor [Acidobacteriota bacterium]|nr:TonB-dependent receptor [Acidobacteriota bacterium]
MMFLRMRPLRFLYLPAALVICWAGVSSAQDSARLQGQVRFVNNGQPIHSATVMVVELSKVVETDAEGRYAMQLPAGSYTVIAYTNSLTAPSAAVEVRSGETRSLDFALELTPLKHEITVTAEDIQQTAFQAVQSVSSLDSIDLSRRHAPGLGEVLKDQPGVSKRSFGPGSSRPVIRGFDGDRVLIMQDGIRVGSLASQSGDHGEPIDSTSLERLEVLKGPATLLYGSNALGGVVNALSGHFEVHTQPHEGTRAKVSTVAGSADRHLGGSLTAEHGVGQWLFWVGGGGQRTRDYETPQGEITNSASRISNARAGLGYYGEKAFASFGYTYNDGRYGIPFAQEFHGHEEEGEGDGGEEEDLEAVDVAFRRHNLRFAGGFRSLGSWINSFKLSLNYTDWGHDELEVFDGGEEIEVGTAFQNRQFVYRGVFQQAQRGLLSGSFGFWGLSRDYDVSGEEALSPPVDESAFALFTLQEIDFEHVKLQFGGRLEHNRFKPQGPQLRGQGNEGGEAELLRLPDRDFTGLSGGVGARFDLWEGGAFVANFVSSYRAPALEELYNFGPHVGNLAFEVGDPDLVRERSNGLDLSLRHSKGRVRAEASFFYYDIDDFVFLAPTGQIEDGLIEADFSQGDSRFVGSELRLDVGVHDSVWLNFGLDTVDAQLTGSGESLPRIPPLRARLGVDFRHDGFSFKPEWVVADGRKEDIFASETPTGGYGVVNLAASYTLPGRHLLHHFSLNVYNVGDKLYRNHLSFIKDFAPEIGRGVSLAYTVELF